MGHTVTIESIEDAAARLFGKALVTPLLENALLNEKVGGRILLKAETLQHCGSFKFRGAYNLLSQLSDDEKARGVLAWSSGNHAQGVAKAAKMLGIEATIVMPKDAPALKVAQVRHFGADIVPYDRYNDVREEIGESIIKERNLVLAPPYDHGETIAGQGVVGLEVAAQARAIGVTIDEFITCCGGGGLTAGCAIALESVSPQTKMSIAEPEGYDDTWLSLVAGTRQSVDPSLPTICDAVATPSPGVLTFPIMQKYVTSGYAVSDEEVVHAVIWAYKYLKMVVEPGGAVALAAILAGKVDVLGKTIGLTLSGGNIDPALFSRILDHNR